MRIALIGRTAALLNGGCRALAGGHTLGLVWTVGGPGQHGAEAKDFEALAKAAQATFHAGPRLPPGLLEAAACDVAFSVNWPVLLPPAILDSFPLGVLNAHAGDLPRYRGNACPNWAILQDEPYIGLCIHLMARELDSGPVVLREKLPLTPDTYVGDAYRWITERIPGMFVAAAEGLAAGQLRPVPQNEAQAFRCYPRRPSDGHIDWTASAVAIRRLIRASSLPFDGAYTTLEGEARLTVWRASIFEIGRFLAVPGQICLADHGTPVIATGEGCLRLDEITLEGVEDEAAAKSSLVRRQRHRLI
jgi:methionyl-tRNA formyltransferase